MSILKRVFFLFIALSFMCQFLPNPLQMQNLFAIDWERVAPSEPEPPKPRKAKGSKKESCDEKCQEEQKKKEVKKTEPLS